MLDGLRRLFATPSLESSGSKGRNYCTELEKAEEKGLPAEKSGVPRLVKVDGEYFTYRLDATFDPLKESSVREALDRYKAELGQTAFVMKEEMVMENGSLFAEITVLPKK
ncbi:MAG TPA: hypothetical protein VJH90_04205 [archaeon]|nr:hypothetical protein [archaeon]